jgi:cell division topological specificity factor
MAWLDYFRRSNPGSASQARDRLSIIVAREGRGKGQPSYLPELRQDILRVLAKYEKINLENVNVSVENQGECEVLELNVTLNSEDDRPGSGNSDDRFSPFFPEAANS